MPIFVILIKLFTGTTLLLEKSVNRGWSPKFATGLNVTLGVDQKIYE